MDSNGLVEGCSASTSSGGRRRSPETQSTWETDEWDFSQTENFRKNRVDDVNRIIWKCITRLNKEGQRSGEFHWIPVKMLQIQRQSVSGMIYKIQLVLAESTTKKENIGAREFGPAINPKIREGGQRRVYEINAWSLVDSSIRIHIFDKIRDVDLAETFPCGYESIRPGQFCFWKLKEPLGTRYSNC